MICSFYYTQKAAFNLRTRPLFNKKFQKMLQGANDNCSLEEIRIGMQKYNPERDNIYPFQESDDYLQIFGPRKTHRVS